MVQNHIVYIQLPEGCERKKYADSQRFSSTHLIPIECGGLKRAQMRHTQCTESFQLQLNLCPCALVLLIDLQSSVNRQHWTRALETGDGKEPAPAQRVNHTTWWACANGSISSALRFDNLINDDVQTHQSCLYCVRCFFFLLSFSQSSRPMHNQSILHNLQRRIWRNRLTHRVALTINTKEYLHAQYIARYVYELANIYVFIFIHMYT